MSFWRLHRRYMSTFDRDGNAVEFQQHGPPGETDPTALDIALIDPERDDLLFERFGSEDRREPPDINVDFKHQRREIVMQWVFDTDGPDHAAPCSTVVRYRTKGALRDVGKVLRLPQDVVSSLNTQFWRWSERRELNRSRRGNSTSTLPAN
jgi:DNA polymerase III alpha subunit